MAGSVEEVIRLVYELSVVDKGTRKLLASEREVQRETKQTAAAMRQQDAAMRRSATVARTTASARSAASRRSVTAAQAEQRQIMRLTRENERLAAANRRASRRGPGVAGSVGGAAASARSTATFGAGIAGAIGVSETVKFDRALRNVNSIAGLTEKQLQALGKRILELAPATAQGPETLAKAMYDLVSSGFDADQSMRILNKSARAATAGLTTTEVSTAAVAAVLNAYHRPASDAANISDTLFQTVNKGVISFEQLASTIGDVLPFASSLGVGLEEVGAAASTLTKAGISPEETMTRLKNLMVTMIKPGDALQDAFKKLGVESGEALIKQKGLQGGLEAIIGTTDGSKQAVAALFPNIRSLGGALALTGKNAKGARSDLASFGNVSGATNKALAEQSKSTAYQWEQAKANAKSLAITVGNGLLPRLNSALKTFTNLPGPVQASAAAFGGFALTIGPLNRLRKNIGEVGSAIGRVAKRASETRIAALLANGARGAGGRIGRALRPVGAAVSSAMTSAAAQGAAALRAPARWTKAGSRAGRLFGRSFGPAMLAGIIAFAPEIQSKLQQKLGIPKGAPTGIGQAIWQKLRGKRAGGRVARMAVGGLVPLLAAGGEVMVDGANASMVPGDPRSDSTLMFARPGSAVLTADGQARMAQGASLEQAIASQAPHFARGGKVQPGRYTSTSYGPPWGGIQGTGVTATGVNLRGNPKIYGVAVDPRVIALGSQVYVNPNPFGRSGSFRAFDTGGAIKGNRLDFYDWRGRKKQNAWGRRTVRVSAARMRGVGTSRDTAGEDVTAHVPLIMGRSSTRGGLLPDALESGVAAGMAGLTRGEARRGSMGARGARRSPVLEAIRGAMTATTREVTIPGAGSESGGGGRQPAGVMVPEATWNPSRKPIARWIVPYLRWASTHGWKGTVTSGFRSKAEQSRIWNSGVRPAARPGTSNHEGSKYPRGAVDVTQASRLAQVLGRKPGPHLLRFAGAKDPVHFSHPHGGSYRRGGVVGGALGRSLAGAMTFRGGTLEALDAAIGGAVEARLEVLRAEVLRRVRAGGNKKTVQRLQSVIDLVDFELGRRIGRYQDVVERRAAAIERGQQAVERGLRLAGVDPASPAGVTVQAGAQAAETTARAQNVASLRRALATAQRSGNTEVIRDVTQRYQEAQDALAESLVRQVELWRDRLRAVAEEAQTQAAFASGLASVGGSILESWQRTAGTSDTAAGMSQRAAYTTGVTLPMLEMQRQAAIFAQRVAAARGDVNGWRAAITDAASAAQEIAAAQAEAADLIRQAALKQAQDVVDAATHGRTMADLRLQRLELEQQLVGTHDTGGGAVGRADFIRSAIIPAIRGEVAALNVQLAAARAVGDAALATQIAEAIYAKENDVLEAQLAAQNAIKDNTDALRDFGGSTAFSYQSQTFTDIDAIRAKVGA